MLFLYLLLLSVSVDAYIETDDGGKINLSEILKRLADLEERLRVQERINEEKSNIIRRLQLQKTDEHHLTKDENKLSETGEDNGNQGMGMDIENKTYITGDKYDHGITHSLPISTIFPRYEKSAKFAGKRIQRRSSEGFFFIVMHSCLICSSRKTRMFGTSSNTFSAINSKNPLY
jgi:hypothetical protein